MLRSPYWPAGLILTLGLGMTLAATAWVSRWEQLSRQTEFQKQTNNLTTALQRTTNRYSDLLLSIGDLYDATGNQVDEQAFKRFVQRAVGSYPGIQALEWAPLVPHGERAAYEQWLQTTTRQTQTTLTERDRTGQLIPAALRPSYVPVTFLEPRPTNEVALGFDLASDETRRIALERSRDTGAIAATGRIQLVQETAGNQYGFLVFVPIYDQPAQTPKLRRQHLRGYVLGVFRVADVVEEALADLDTDLDFYILDQTARPAEQLLGVYDAQTQQVIPQPDTADELDLAVLCANGADCRQRLNLGQREWQIVFVRSPHRSPPWGTLATLLIGLLMTATLLIYLARWQAELSRTRELSDLKLRLFSMASHELRTPLSVITVSAQSLETNRDHLTLPQQASTIDRIQQAAKRMGQLVSDILTLARAEAGKLEFSPEIVGLAPFCQQVLDQIQPKPGQTLTLAGVPANFRAYVDKTLLQSILLNLVANGVKYSPEGREIRLAVTPAAETLTFTVMDHGIGIPAEAREQVFNAFYRGKNVGQVPGTGLGLAVVKTCVELHGGHLTVKSAPDQGTAIAVILPRVE